MTAVAMDTEKARLNMIQRQIRPWGVLDPGVLALLGAVRREDFVPVKYRELAFADAEIPRENLFETVVAALDKVPRKAFVF
jgi:protein-L-isoaspartate O-methyltransferase